jgi:hypothetical protein
MEERLPGKANSYISSQTLLCYQGKLGFIITFTEFRNRIQF